MSDSKPEGEFLPLPESVGDGSEERAFGVYLHVPYCRVRCGYCDFNTYTASELGETKQSDFANLASQEILFARRTLDSASVAEREVSSVFFGGGTPTLLPSSDLVSMLQTIRETWPLGENAEVTTEANPDSVDATSLEELRLGGFNRISFGMQSAVPKVLETLDRTHDPARVSVVTRSAKDLEFQVSLDLIYGTPGETLDDWKRSVDAALDCEPDHVSAYSLIVEPGTKLAAQIKRGEIPAPDPDLQAEMYTYSDELFSGEGFAWYEVSNWARGEEFRSRHNLAYWQNADWWGVGPGAHSHIGGIRWWNVKHPSAYANRVAAGVSPEHEREVLTHDQKHLERIMLGIRLVDGLPTSTLSDQARLRVAELIAEELVEPQQAFDGHLVLTQRGRLLADAVVRSLTD
jgi:oxygen-independent coproporphyrinogen-3 oxidase